MTLNPTWRCRLRRRDSRASLDADRVRDRNGSAGRLRIVLAQWQPTARPNGADALTTVTQASVALARRVVLQILARISRQDSANCITSRADARQRDVYVQGTRARSRSDGVRCDRLRPAGESDNHHVRCAKEPRSPASATARTTA